MKGKNAQLRTVGFVLAAVLTAPAAPRADVTVSINQNTAYQTITGLGGQHFNIWKVRQGVFYLDVDLDASHIYDTLIQDLGLSFVRYYFRLSNQTDPYSYTFDGETHAFGERYTKLQAAAARAGFDLKVTGSVLSAPIYMKWVKVDQSEDHDGMDPQYYDELGEHIVSYLQAMEDTYGLVHYAFSPQNEPFFDEPYSQTNFFEDQTYTNMFRVVAPRVKQHDPDLKVFFPEHLGRLDWLTGPTWDRILHDQTLAPYADIGAVHGYLDGIAPDLGSADGWAALYNNVHEHGCPLWMTETEGYDGDFSKAFDFARALFAALKYGKISAWSYLHITGTERGYLVNGQKTQLYYSAKQFFRFARPSMVQVESSASDNNIRVLAFHQQQKNGLGIIIMNVGSSDRTASISITGSYVPTSYSLMRYSSTDQNSQQQNVAPGSILLKANSVTSLWAGPDPIGISADATPVAPRRTDGAVSAARFAPRSQVVFSLQGRRVEGPDCAQRLGSGVYLRKSGQGAAAIHMEPASMR